MDYMNRVLTILFSLVLIIGVATACSTPQSTRNAASIEPICPEARLGETPQDCPWAGVARALTQAAKEDRPLRPLLEKSVPDLVRQIESDSHAQQLKDIWGQSINYDENAKAIIVEPETLRTLGEIFGAAAEGRIVHAGLEHTYGYLFSNLQTPFGYKRARWVRSTIEDGFRLPSGLLGPSPAEGTFFSNATYFFGRIAFRKDREQRRAITEVMGVPHALVKFPYARVAARRLTEKVEVNQPRVRTVVLRTDLIQFFTVPGGQKNTHLLIYSIDDPLNGGPKLITAFPVEASFVDRVFNPATLGENQPVITRYNGFVEGLTGQEFKGSRYETQDRNGS